MKKDNESEEQYRAWLERVNHAYELLLNEKTEAAGATSFMRALQGKFYRTVTVADLIELYVFGQVDEDDELVAVDYAE